MAKLYLRPLVIAGCYTACLYAVAEAIAHTWNPFEPAAATAVLPLPEPAVGNGSGMGDRQ